MNTNTIHTVSEDFINLIKKEYGSPVYIFDEVSFVDNYNTLKNAFQKYYPKYNIAYSYKTNYTPYICKLVHSMGGLAEVVSDFEYYVAKSVGYDSSSIIYNGPCKQEMLEEHLLGKGIINIDNYEECMRIIDVASKYPDSRFEVGIRANINIGQPFVSRFGMDPKAEDFKNALLLIHKQPNIELTGIHCHIGQSRTIEHWRNRVTEILTLADKIFTDKPPKYIDLGSGMFGDMEAGFKEQFDEHVPAYDEYAQEVAGRILLHYEKLSEGERPYLYTEPGATAVSRYMWLVGTVISHKKVQNIDVTGLDCSYFNASETSRYKRLPIRIIGHKGDFKGGKLVGYTCLEDDVIYPDYEGNISVGDTVVLGNTGGYSLVFKPPFILPDIPVVAMKQNEETELIKRRQSFDDMLMNYVF